MSFERIWYYSVLPQRSQTVNKSLDGIAGARTQWLGGARQKSNWCWRKNQPTAAIDPMWDRSVLSTWQPINPLYYGQITGFFHPRLPRRLHRKTPTAFGTEVIQLFACRKQRDFRQEDSKREEKTLTFGSTTGLRSKRH